MTRKTPTSTGSVANTQRSKSLSQLVGKILEPTVARRAGMTLDLMRAWPELVGVEFAKTTSPLKIEWPRRAMHDENFQPATLVVASDGASAVFLQHQQDEILQQVNLFFGFQAINKLRVVQRSVSKAAPPSRPEQRKLTADEERRLSDMVRHIEDVELKSTVLKLGRELILANSPFISD